MRLLVSVFFWLVVTAGVSQADSLSDRQGWKVIPTEQSYSDLVESVKAAVKAEKMLLVTQASASSGAKGRGLKIPGNRIMGVYRNDYAIRMLEASVAAGIEAPIRFYVTENSDGTGTLSWKTPGFVFAPYMEEGGEALAELAAELDGVFQTIADNAVASR
ncbi:DUF302 domain-containing protein [Roseibium porphyridii]|uniref:DUF302 domain-containing protein n=1 Tax=Roseibium porphyridii TaxID=2866279 RepID=A0ABY8F246_9HYPH|nr:MULTISPECIES: DUF302 domain-containing protein [Stappiaceae]QFT34592.1 hypothetical protein FIV00_29120 [Labrenzia sp. THAF82]WFE89561.1 DUF302 domain-containing protein [Roseibium sp. KMA01]